MWPCWSKCDRDCEAGVSLGLSFALSKSQDRQCPPLYLLPTDQDGKFSAIAPMTGLFASHRDESPETISKPTTERLLLL